MLMLLRLLRMVAPSDPHERRRRRRRRNRHCGVARRAGGVVGVELVRRDATGSTDLPLWRAVRYAPERPVVAWESAAEGN